MQFRVLGRLVAESGGLDVAPVRPKRRALLALLLLRAGEAVPRDELIDALWGEHPPASAATALHGHISDLRKRLGGERIVTRFPGYALELLEGDDLDVVSLDRIRHAARTARGEARTAALAEALALFRGEPLAEFRYEPFAASESARLEELHLTIREDLMEAELDAGRYDDAIAQLEALIAEHSLRERPRALLMLALYRAGRQADALKAFRDARMRLRDELGVEPGPPLRELERRILNQDPELAAPSAFVAQAPLAAAAGVPTCVHVRVDDDAAAVGVALAQCGGVEDDAPPGVVVAAFARARDAAAGAVAVQRATRGTAAIGINSAEDPDEAANGAEAVAGAAHPGQVLVSRSARDLLAETPAAELALVDAGRHRLRDLGAPWQLFWLAAPGAHASKPARGLDNFPTNLPSHPTPLVGRRTELRELAELLRGDRTRLVTLTGPAGVGKTRLAMHAAARVLDDFPDGVFVVQLAAVTDPELVWAEVARTLDLERDGRTEARRVAHHLATHRVLLVLDNLEHLVATGSEIADAVAASRSTLLTTSRVPLRTAAEQEVKVRPLPERDAISLFATRARAVRDDFELTPENTATVARVCAALDGLPLAIELAAGRAAVLSPPALLQRLDRRLDLLKRRAGGPARQRTLRAAIDWSYELLDTEQRELLAALAVFAGGFDLDAVEALVGDNAVDGLSALVDANLLQLTAGGDEPRFGLLETVREYARERLAASGRADDLQRRHARWFLTLAERAEPNLREAPGIWLERLREDADNLRAALAWLQATGSNAELLRLAGAMWRFWYLNGRLGEGREWLERALAAAPGSATAERAKALLGLTVMCGNLGDYTASRRLAEETRAISLRLGDAWSSAYATHLLARALHELGDTDSAVQLSEESAGTFERLGDRHSGLLVTRSLALLLADRGDNRRAREVHEENLRIAREAANPRIEATTLATLAVLTADDGRLADALPMLRRSLSIHRELGDVLDTSLDLCRCAYVLSRAGRLDVAARLLFAVDRLGDAVGARRTWVARTNEQARVAIEQHLDPTVVDAARKDADRMTLDDALALAIDAI